MKMTQEELNSILELHKKWLKIEKGGMFANLTGANLVGANLRRVNLAGADLAEADLTGANLTGADLTGADLTGANLRRVNLAEADLTGANLRRANLVGANLTGANLTGADLDFSCLPLWCGSLNMIIDERLEKQILYHLISIVHNKERYRDLLSFANESHVVTIHGRKVLEI